MTHYKTTKWLLSTAILSMSLLTVMAGAAIAPALGAIETHFRGIHSLLIQLLVSLPALFIVLTGFFFAALCRRFNTRQLVLGALVLYVAAGTGALFFENIWLILMLRALLGVAVGVIMPLSTGLLVFYFAPEKQARLMGLSSSMNYMGGVVATLLAGVLSNVSWELSFLVYLMGVPALVLCARYLPASWLPSHGGNAYSPNNVRRYWPLVTAMLLVMGIFFIYPTNFAIISLRGGVVSPWAVAPIMALLDVVAFLMGVKFADVYRRCGRFTFFLAPLTYMVGYAVLMVSPGYAAALVGSVIVGIGSGLGVPLVFATAARAAGREAATSIIPMLGAALYLGQFLTPFLVEWLAPLFRWSACAPYWVALLLSLLLLMQGWADSRRVK